MKLLYTNGDQFPKYADPDNPRIPLVNGGAFRNANRWDGRPEVAEEVLIDPQCNLAADIGAAYEEFEWEVPGSYPGSKRRVRAKITLLDDEHVIASREQLSRERATKLDIPVKPKTRQLKDAE